MVKHGYWISRTVFYYSCMSQEWNIQTNLLKFMKFCDQVEHVTFWAIFNEKKLQVFPYDPGFFDIPKFIGMKVFFASD